MCFYNNSTTTNSLSLSIAIFFFSHLAIILPNHSSHFLCFFPFLFFTQHTPQFQYYYYYNNTLIFFFLLNHRDVPLLISSLSLSIFIYLFSSYTSYSLLPSTFSIFFPKTYTFFS